MKLVFWSWVMSFAWTIDEYADGFVEWAQQKYWDELHGIGRIG